MKTKNLFLGFAAFVCAVGTAFATLTPLTNPVYIWTRSSSQVPFECRSFNVTCDDQIGTSCQVAVSISGSGTKNPFAHDSECSLILDDQNGSASAGINLPAGSQVSNDGETAL